MSGGHDVFAPSSAATWMNCTFSARNGVPDPPKKASTKAASDEGTRVHDLFDVAVSQMEFPEDGDTAADAVALGLDFVRQLEPGQTYTEMKLRLSAECGGTTDFFRYNPSIFTLLDLKNGKWDVDAYHNKQLLSYAAMVLQFCLQHGLAIAEYFRLVIFQPNGLDEIPFKQWIATRAEVEAHRHKMLEAIADRSPPRPGPWCRWCKAFQQCPAMAQDAYFVVGAMARPVESLTTEELVRLLRLIRALGDNKEMYEEALTTHLKLGRTADGAVLKSGRAWRAWNDPTQAAQVLHQTYGFKGVKPVTPAQAEKLGGAGKAYASVGAHKPPGELKASY